MLQLVNAIASADDLGTQMKGRVMVEIEHVVQNLERFYEAMTGRSILTANGQHALIPPEKGLERHTDEQIDRLLGMISGPLSGPTGVTGGVAGGPLGRSAQLGDAVQPPCSIVETPQEIAIRLDIPGVRRDAMKISVSRNLLTVEGVRELRDAQPGDEQIVRRVEQWRGRFRRQFALPEGVLTEALSARLADGVLEIRVPRSPVQEGARDIPIAEG